MLPYAITLYFQCGPLLGTSIAAQFTSDLKWNSYIQAIAKDVEKSLPHSTTPEHTSPSMLYHYKCQIRP